MYNCLIHSIQRIQTRNRTEESGVNIDYLQLIHDQHEQWLLAPKQEQVYPRVWIEFRLNYRNACYRIPVLVINVRDSLKFNPYILYSMVCIFFSVTST